MDLERFRSSPIGSLVEFSGTAADGSAYSHAAFHALPLGDAPQLSNRAWTAVGDARGALGRLHQGSRWVGNTAFLRQPTLRREAQSTSALEGTFAPLDEVLAADVIEQSSRTSALNEVLNFVDAAEEGFAWINGGRPISVSLLCGLHRRLVRGTAADTQDAGRVRTIQVAIGSPGGNIEDARFVPMRPGTELEAAFFDLVRWITDASLALHLDPVVAAAMAHYQFETLHPFNDGNGRIGRLLIVLQLLQMGALPDSLLSVSPWFEARRELYQQHLAQLSATGDWNEWIEFFARGIEASAVDTARRIERVLDLRDDYHRRMALANVRGVARDIADLMVASPYATLTKITAETGKPYQTTKNAVERLIELGILEDVPAQRQRIVRAREVVEAYRT